MDPQEIRRTETDSCWPRRPPSLASERLAGHLPVGLPSSTFLFLRVLRALLNDPLRVVLMIRVAVSYLTVAVLARRMPLPAAFAWISPRLAARSADERGLGRIVNAVDTLLVAGIPLIHPQCWRRAAVLHRFLRHAGVDTKIVFGVDAESTQPLDAHAWIEREGRPFAEPASVARYRRVFEFPDPRRA